MMPSPYQIKHYFSRDIISVNAYSKNASEVVKELSNKLCVETEIGNIKIEPINVAVVENNVALSKWDYISKIAKDKQKISKINEKIVKSKEILNISNENLKIYENMNSISATMLENYFKCPFYMFLFNVLKIKPRLDNDILSFDIGNVLHEITFKYYKNKKQVGDIYDFCKKEVFAFVDKDDRLKLNLNSPILINLIDEAVRVICGLNYMDENSSFVPFKFEHEFKGEKALKLDNIDVIGKIDRVDVSGDMLRVVDYKSGKADANLKELYYGNNYSFEAKYHVIRTADQELGSLRSDDNMYRLDEEEYQKRIRRLSLDKDDIVYGREGERWGLACIVPESDKYCLGQRMMQFRCNTKLIIPKFAMWALNSK